MNFSEVLGENVTDDDIKSQKNRASLYFWKTDFWNSHGEGGERGRLVRVRNYFLKLKFVGNKANGWISKWVFQENKTYQIFRQTNISYPLIRCVSGGKKFLFFGKFDVPCFLEKPVLRFTILPYYRRIVLGNWNYYRSWVYLLEKICPAVAISVKNIISKQQFTTLVHLKKKWKVIEVHLHTKFRKNFIKGKWRSNHKFCRPFQSFLMTHSIGERSLINLGLLEKQWLVCGEIKAFLRGR